MGGKVKQAAPIPSVGSATQDSLLSWLQQVWSQSRLKSSFSNTDNTYTENELCQLTITTTSTPMASGSLMGTQDLNLFHQNPSFPVLNALYLQFSRLYLPQDSLYFF